MAVHGEASFEAAIEADLLGGGWQKGSPGHYRPALGLDTAELMAFFGATQAKAFDKLTGYYGGIEKAQRKVAERIAAEIDSRGTLDVLRRGVKDHGVLLRLAYFAPAHAIAPELQQLYAANRLTVTRQLRYSARRPASSTSPCSSTASRSPPRSSRTSSPARASRMPRSNPHSPRPAGAALRQTRPGALRR